MKMNSKILACVTLVLLTGCATPVSTNEPTISFAWSYRAGDYVRAVPTVSDGVVYVGADDNTLHAVQADTGESVWSYQTGDNITSSSTVYEDAIYFGSTSIKVTCAGNTRRMDG
jgi:outer membrane protein assembly factor BamB